MNNKFDIVISNHVDELIKNLQVKQNCPIIFITLSTQVREADDAELQQRVTRTYSELNRNCGKFKQKWLFKVSRRIIKVKLKISE